jgi:hypothetical protein
MVFRATDSADHDARPIYFRYDDRDEATSGDGQSAVNA